MSYPIPAATAARLMLFVCDATTYEPVTGLAYSDVTSAAFRTRTNGVASSTTTITLTSTAAQTAAVATGQWVEFGGGYYGVDVGSGSVPASGSVIEAVVSITGKLVTAERHFVDATVSSRSTFVAGQQVDLVDAPNATALQAIGTEFLAHTLTKGTAGSIERALWQLSKTTTSVDGTVVDNAANSATTFHTNITAATGQFDHQLLVFTSGDLEGEARPIDTFASSGGVIVLQEPLTAEPAADDEFLILPYHVHPISEIVEAIDNDSSVLAEILDDTGTALVSQHVFTQALIKQLVPQITIVGNTGNTTTSVHLPGLTYGDDEIAGRLLILYDGSNEEYHPRWVESWDLSNELATVSALPFTPSQPDDTWTLTPFKRDDMVLKDDSITASKFDESTAYPIKSADTGSTQIFRTGTDGDTGETISDQIDALANTAPLEAF